MMTDGAGQEVSETVAAKAVEQFAELWGSGSFDCGPQDYELMAGEILAKFRAGDTRELKAALRWIPVEEKWPEVNAYVWFWVPSLGEGGNWETGYFRDSPDEGAEFECERTGPQDEFIVYDDQQVTHWMLAELPRPSLARQDQVQS